MTSLFNFLGVSGFDSTQVPTSDLPLPNQLIGLELEVDTDSTSVSTTSFPESYRPEWTRKRDGSLNNGYEYVLTGPLSGQSLVNAVHKLFSGDTRVHRTYTGSTHIHVNMLDGTTLENLQALSLLTYAMEGLLYYIGDNSRQWCGYANRMTGAPHAVLENLLGADVQRRGLRSALNSAGRYYGLNLAALEKFGTVEFRYFPTATSAEEMLSWVKLVQIIKKAACDMGNIATVLEVLSDKSKYAEFVNNYLPEYAEAIEASCPYSKVKILANKALVIANARSTTRGVTWNKELLSSIFFPSAAVEATPTIAPIRAKILVLGTSNTVPTANAAKELAVSEGFETVILSYNSNLYHARNHSYGSEWQMVYEEAIAQPVLYESLMSAAEAGGVPATVIIKARGLASRVRGGAVSAARHNRFQPFEETITASYDDEPDHDDYDDEEDY